MKFANIDEETPSYHRRYDFFVCKFTSLCYNKHDDLEIRRRLRVAGLNGIKGVIRKTVSDDLQVDIWDNDHMGKIIPSLLYNMQETPNSSRQTTPESDSSSGMDVVDGRVVDLDLVGNSAHFQNSKQLLGPPQPALVAEANLRELMGKANFGNIRSAIFPVLNHLDHFHLWHTVAEVTDQVGKSKAVEESFAVEIFRIIMNSIQSQHSNAVIQVSASRFCTLITV